MNVTDLTILCPDFPVPAESLALLREELLAGGIRRGALHIRAAELAPEMAAIRWEDESGVSHETEVPFARLNDLSGTHAVTQHFLMKLAVGRLETEAQLA